MKAMILEKPRTPLRLREVATPSPHKNQLLVKVRVCGVCRTDLHVVDGDLTEPKLPIIPGHQIVGDVQDIGADVGGFSKGDRVGIPWLGGSCGKCEFCLSERENLCDFARYTGYQIDGGFAEYTLADPRFCFSIPGEFPDLQAAPLLCAGLIGYRSYHKVGSARRIGFYGFGAAAHILAQICVFEDREVYAFTREGDTVGQTFARKMGAVWAGTSGDSPPERLDAAIIFAPAGELLPLALKAVKKGGIVVCAGIHMSDIPSFPYSILWDERSITSVANLTRRDGEAFLSLAPKVPVRTSVQPYPLDKANDALDDLRAGRFSGAAVVVVDPEATRG